MKRLFKNSLLLLGVIVIFALLFILPMFMTVFMARLNAMLGSEWISYYGNIIGGSIGGVTALMILTIQSLLDKKKELDELKQYHENIHVYFSHYVMNNLTRFEEEIDKELIRTKNRMSDRHLEKDFVILTNQMVSIEVDIEKLLVLKTRGIISDTNYVGIQNVIWDLMRFNQIIESYVDDRRIYFETIAQSMVASQTSPSLQSFLEAMKLYWVNELVNIKPLIANIRGKIDRLTY